MCKPPAFQLYAQDFLTGVMYLTNEEIGMYMKLLCKQWTDGSIPKKRVAFLIGCEWENVSEELKDKFILEDNLLKNKRLEEERNKQIAFKKKQSENGKKGGRGNKKKPNINPNKNQKKPLEDEDEDRRVKNEKEDEKEDSFCEVEIFPTFDDFWNEYDKKIGKREKIKTKWEKLSQSTKEKIMLYLPEYKKSQPEKKYRKNPETFLNNESWKDELILESNEKQSTKNPIGASDEFRRKTAERLGIIQP